MPGKQIICPDCGGGCKYTGLSVRGRIQLGFHCLGCSTIRERFSNFDVVVAVP